MNQNKDYPSKKQCEACGRDFGCGSGAQFNCWCADVYLSETMRGDLRKKYLDCLCPDCLKKVAESDKQRIRLK